MLFSIQWSEAMREIMSAAKRMAKCHGKDDEDDKDEDEDEAGVNCDGIENAVQCVGGMRLEQRCRRYLKNESDGGRS